MDIEKQQTLKSTLSNILMILSVLCINQNVKASETSERIVDKLAYDLTYIDPEGESGTKNSEEMARLKEEAQAEAWFRAKYSDVREYVKLDGNRISYDQTRDIISKDQLPLMYELLKDEEYAPHWHKIAKSIGFISDDPNSVSVLLEYFQRDEGSKVHHMLGKIESILWMGLIAGDMADYVLRKAAAREGAIELAQNWIKDGLWIDKNLSEDLLIGFIQGNAMKGLVLTRKTENIQIVKEMYSKEKERILKEKKGRISGSLVDAMAMNDYIVDRNEDVGSYFRRDPEIDFSFRDYIRKYIFSYPEEDSANTSSNDKANELREYVKRRRMLYNETRELFGEEQLPLLYEMLTDDSYSRNWGTITQVIGFISEPQDSKSVNVLLDFFKRDDGVKDFFLSAKIWSLAWIGMIGGEQADSILKKAFTKEGARELAKDWIDEKLWQEDYYKQSEENLYNDIQYAVLDGLVYSRKKENLDLVEKFYNQQKEISIKNKAATEMMSFATTVMAKKDFLADKSFDEYFKIWQSDNGTVREPYLKMYRVTIPEKSSSDETYIDPLEYIKFGGVSYQITRERFGKDDLPLFYDLLRDEKYAAYWHNIARIIGYISDDPDSVPVLLDYFQRNDGFNISDQSRFLGKVWSLAWVGQIGGELAGSVLRKAATVQGAEELSKEWINKELWSIGDRERTIQSIQRAAIHGLVYSGKKGNLDFVEKLYNEQKEISLKNNATSDIMDTLIDAMAKKDFIADNSIEEFYRIEGKEMEYLPGLDPYLTRYGITFPMRAFNDLQAMDPKEVFAKKWIGGLSYPRVKNTFNAESVPVLNELLSNPQYSYHWYNIAFALCYISEDSDSVEEIKKYIQRPKELSNEGFDIIEKGRILNSLGFMKNNKINDLLVNALTEEGAYELTKSWIDKTEDYSDTFATREEMLGYIRGSAAIGLVNSQFPTNIRLVEQLYEKEFAKCKEKRIHTELFNKLLEAMASQDMIERIRMPEYLKLQGKENIRLREYIIKYDWQSPEEAWKEKIKVEYSDIAEYVKQDFITYSLTREMFDKDDLPKLYELLNDDDYSPFWDRIARIIAFISNDTDSVAVLLDYIKRDDGAKEFSMGGKTGSLSLLGLIGGELADSVLKKSVTIEGARELAKEWIDEELWQEGIFKEHKELVIPWIRNAALSGLAISAKKENHDYLEKLYLEEKNSSEPNLELGYRDALIEAMMLRGCIEDHGIETYFNLLGESSVMTLMPYFEKYKL